MKPTIVALRDQPALLEEGIDYFSTIWGIDRRIYADCISHSLETKSPLPRWYLLKNRDETIGSYGLITNDFISRQDLYPWLCALYIDEKMRGSELGAKLLAHGIEEANKLGYSNLYLCTDHVGYYEKYGWTFIGMGYHPWGDESRIYAIQTE